jgi:hypothetical protein
MDAGISTAVSVALLVVVVIFSCGWDSFSMDGGSGCRFGCSACFGMSSSVIIFNVEGGLRFEVTMLGS